MDSATGAKTYWSILKTILNNKKIPCTPPLFQQGKYVTDLKKKAELFNSFFAKRCSIIQNSSKLPLTLNKKTTNSISRLPSTVMILQQLSVVLILTKLMSMI